ncbi:MAG: Xaa-Pro peptidase family protein [Sulfolobales archaeon]
MLMPQEVFEERVRKLQKSLVENGIECAIIRTQSDFKYLVGAKWLRPSLLVPAEGSPIALIVKGEEDGFLERVKLKKLEVVTYVEGGDLMGKVSALVRSLGSKRVGMVFGVERDSYVLFYEMFKRANRSVEVVDISRILVEMRAIKESFELDAISRASDISSRVLEKALSSVSEGVSETDIAAEAYYLAYKLGSEEPHVYVNAGPHPRVHSEPSREVRVRKNTFVTVVVGSDFSGYYANTSASTFIGSKTEEVNNALKCVREVYEVAKDLTKPGTKFTQVISHLDTVYAKYGLIDKRLVGYVHGVGLQVEEYPITTIVPAHRAAEPRRGMVLALVHSPLVMRGYGTLKLEDTFIVVEDGLRPLTRAWELME